MANYIDEHGAVSMEDVRQETHKSALLQKLIKCLRTGELTGDSGMRPFMSADIVHDLHVIDGIVFRGKRVVIPESLHDRIIKVSHEGHQGICKTKALVRQFCWFPGLDKKVERRVRECLPCQSVQPSKYQEPIKHNELPDGPWQYTEMDFQGPYPKGDYIFVLIDRYSHWPEVAFFKNAPTSVSTIKVMKEIFSRKGIPYTCQSDNGQPFRSTDMKTFANQSGFSLKHIVPEWPRANGTVERFNRSMKEAIQAGYIEGKQLRETATTFVQAFRATPHSTTGISPFAAMHGGREMRVKLPLPHQKDRIINRERVEHTKSRMMKYCEIR